MTETPTLATWFRTTVETQGVASRSTLYTLVGLKTCRIVILIAGFWLFAHMMHSLVVLATAPSMADWIGLSVALLLAWLLQGEANRRTLDAKTQLLQDLEVRFARHLAIGQLAMVSQQSPYYWQSLWLHHIPALANWRYDYQVQQYVAVLAPIIALAGLFMVNWLIGLSLLITLPIVPL
ncbi:MAG: ABC transporter ATP-binding protein, partial [Aestuariibacter sp.]|nr:ABC transporter ATP-binding protein [Aestuariibacter sp.]